MNERSAVERYHSKVWDECAEDFASTREDRDHDLACEVDRLSRDIRSLGTTWQRVEDFLNRLRINLDAHDSFNRRAIARLQSDLETPMLRCPECGNQFPDKPADTCYGNTCYCNSPEACWCGENCNAEARSGRQQGGEGPNAGMPTNILICECGHSWEEDKNEVPLPG